MERPLVVGDEVDGKYRVVRHLASGGMGHVYEAEDRILQRRVALKVLSRRQQLDAVARERLLREGRAAAGIRHPGIVQVYEVGTDGEMDYVAMQLLDGEDLHARVQREGPLPAAFVQRLAADLADAMIAMHEAGIVHRDLKPRNIFLAREGSARDVLKVLDFGIAKLALARVDTLTETGQVFGTLNYMAPEQLRGARNADERSDLWSAGAVLYEASTGRPPFEADTGPELVFKIAVEDPVSVATLRTDIAPPLERVISAALQRDPAKRPQSARALAAMLLEGSERANQAPDVRLGTTGGAHSLTPAASKTAEAATFPAPKDRRRTAVAMGALALVLVGLVGFELRRRSTRPRPAAPAGMVWIEGGRMSIGRSHADLDRECRALGAACNQSWLQREAPSQRVDVPSFMLDVHEVNNAQFANTLNQLLSSFYMVDDEDYHYPRFVRWNKDLGHDEEFLIDLHPTYGGIEYTKERRFAVRKGSEMLPVSQVSWYGANLHCKRLGKRLPTEDEWEVAARGADDRRFPWGAAPPGCAGVVLPRDGSLPLPAECPELATPRAVGQAAQDVTIDGVHDLGGNVAEWVDSTFVEGNRHAHPVDPAGLLPRVVRGGSWGSAFLARSTARTRRPPGSAGANVGFRCAVSATP